MSTAEIARRAEVSEGLLFHYFPTKEALWLAVASGADSFARRAADALAAAGPGPVLVDTLAREFGQMARVEREVLAVLLGAAFRGDPLGDQMRSAQQLGAQGLASGLAAAGLLRLDDDPEVIATGVIGALGQFFLVHHRATDAEWTERAEAFARAWLTRVLLVEPPRT